jgi:hypothetical protein
LTRPRRRFSRRRSNSGAEEKFVVNAKIGQGILVTQEGRVPFYDFLSDKEKRLFAKSNEAAV